MKSILLWSLVVAITLGTSSLALAGGRHKETTSTIIRIGDIEFGQIHHEGKHRRADRTYRADRHGDCCESHRPFSKHEMKKARRLARRHARLHRKMERHARRTRHQDFREHQHYAYRW